MAEPSRPSQPPVSAHGLIGDLRTAALVSRDGTIDWFCPGRFDSPSVFASILDPERGGHWRICPREEHRVAQFYFPDTNVLVTRFMTDDGMVELQDLMPVGDDQRLVRRLDCVRGAMKLDCELAPRFDYGRTPHRARRARGGVVLATGELELTLMASAQLHTRSGDVHAEVDVREGEAVTFVLHIGEVHDRDCHLDDAARALLEETVAYWRGWIERSAYRGRWREMVNRSALALKLLTYAPTGAIVAAPTTALPEAVGGERNWDYRYVWMRDAAFTVYALIRLGFTEEARAFNAWTCERVAARDPKSEAPLQTMYCVDGTPDLDEEELPHLAGYRDSRPVRIGNAIAQQLQLDIYGELIDSMYLFDRYGEPISHDTWEALTGVLNWLLDNWDRADGGIWELRGGEQRHVFSRLMSWVAIERMVRIARRRGLPADLNRWVEVRDEIYRQIIDRGYNEERGAFAQELDGEALDASLLLMPMVKFCSGTDPRFVSTLEAIESELVVDSLVYRYRPESSNDGVGGAEGTFSVCSFWYVEALTRAGRLAEARKALEKTFTYANHLGLYAEQISPTGEQRGNFPQGLTHFALISAAYNLDRALAAQSE